MKKKCLSLFVFSFLFLIVSCNFGLQEIKRNVELTRIEVDTTNARTVFDINTEFSSEGLIIYGYNSDGSKFAIENDYCKIDSGEYNQAETYEGYEIKVSYSGFSTSYFVDVIDTRVIEIELSNAPDNTLYRELNSLEQLNLTGMEIKVKFSNGKIDFYSGEMEINGYKVCEPSNVVGINNEGHYYTQTIDLVLFYGELSINLPVMVATSEVEKIVVYGKLEKTHYTKDDIIELNGLTVEVHFVDNKFIYINDLKILSINYLPVDPENTKEMVYEQPFEICFGGKSVSYITNKLTGEKESDLFVLIVTDYIVGFKIEEKINCPHYYYKNEEFDYDKYELIYIFHNEENKKRTVMEVCERTANVIFEEFSTAEIGVYPLKATYTFTNALGEQIKAKASYNIMVTDSILSEISEAIHNRLNNELDVDFPAGVIPDNSGLYGKWTVKALFSDGVSELSDISDYCSFQKITEDAEGNNLLIKYYDSRTPRGNESESEGHYIEKKVKVVYGLPRLLELDVIDKPLNFVAGDTIDVDTIKEKLIGKYTDSNDSKGLIDEDSSIIQISIDNKDFIDSTARNKITLNAEYTNIYVKIKDRYFKDSYIFCSIPISVAPIVNTGIEIFNKNDSDLYIIKGEEENWNENISVSLLKNNQTEQVITETELLSLNLIPLKETDYKNAVACKVTADYKDENKELFTDTYYGDEGKMIYMLPPKINYIKVNYSSEHTYITKNNLDEVIENASYDIYFGDGSNLLSIPFNELKNYNISVNKSDDKSFLINFSAIEEFEVQYGDYTKTFGPYYVLEDTFNKFEVKLKEKFNSNNKLKLHKGKSYNWSDYFQVKGYLASNTNNPQDITEECSFIFDYNTEILYATYNDITIKYSDSESIQILKPNIIGVACYTNGIVYTGYEDIESYAYTVYFEDGTNLQNLTYEKLNENDLQLKKENNSNYILKYKDEITNTNDVIASVWKTATFKLTTQDPIIKSVSISLKESINDSLSYGIKVDNSDNKFEKNIDNLFDIYVYGIDGKQYVVNYSEKKFWRKNDEDQKYERNAKDITINYTKNDNSIYIDSISFKDDYENTCFCKLTESIKIPIYQEINGDTIKFASTINWGDINLNEDLKTFANNNPNFVTALLNNPYVFYNISNPSIDIPKIKINENTYIGTYNSENYIYTSEDASFCLIGKYNSDTNTFNLYQKDILNNETFVKTFYVIPTTYAYRLEVINRPTSYKDCTGEYLAAFYYLSNITHQDKIEDKLSENGIIHNSESNTFSFTNTNITIGNNPQGSYFSGSITIQTTVTSNN
ncbi:MAG: hypothetical protein MJ185_03865 [Treponema sp.]|nr:hypothetical protein [Treponema sp.]